MVEYGLVVTENEILFVFAGFPKIFVSFSQIPHHVIFLLKHQEMLLSEGIITKLTLLYHVPTPTALPWLAVFLSFSLIPVSSVYTVFVANHNSCIVTTYTINILYTFLLVS